MDFEFDPTENEFDYENLELEDGPGSSRYNYLLRTLQKQFPDLSSLEIMDKLEEQYQGRFNSMQDWINEVLLQGEDVYLLPEILNYVDFDRMGKELGFSPGDIDFLFQKDPDKFAFPQLDSLSPDEYEKLLPYFDFNSYVEDKLQQGKILALPTRGGKIDIFVADELSQ